MTAAGEKIRLKGVSTDQALEEALKDYRDYLSIL